MATSGTIGQTTINVMQLIDDAHRLASTKPQVITGEQINFAKRQLFLFLSSWANRGINLYTITNRLEPQVVGKRLYDLPTGAIEVLNVNHREITTQGTTGGTSSAGGAAGNAFDGNLTTACTQTSADGNISYDFGSSVTVASAAFVPNGTRTYALVYESSTDNSTWTTVETLASASYVDNVFVWTDFTTPVAGRYFRVRETGGATLDVRQLVFGRNPTETDMSRQPRDDYVNQTDKATTGTPTMYWVDRQSTPRIWIWTASKSSFDVLSIWHTSHIQDVGVLTNEIAVPQRWQDAVQYELAARVCMNLDGVALERRNELRALAKQSFDWASEEERDRSEVMLTPDVGGYSGSA